jgi:phosphoribosyl-ATP pyrophosphohydrolase
MAADGTILDQLFATVRARKGGDPTKSYTAKLFAEGRGKIARKMGEESVETIVAALTEGKERVASESADLLYHLLVLWADCGVAPADVWADLAARQGKSGIEEKKGRG